MSGHKIRDSYARNWDLYLILVPVLVYFLVFRFIPMYGVQLAFKDFYANKGITGSPWVGFKHFIRFFNGYYFFRLLFNTISLSVYQLAAGFPVPIILALMMNELRGRNVKKIVQTITYAPHFLSTVVVVGIMTSMLSPSSGLINHVLLSLGMKETVSFMTEPGWFKTLYVLSGVWQDAGWNTVIYMAALATIDPQLYEAAVLDGANRMQRIRHVTLAGLIPTTIVLLILNSGKIMSIGFEKAYLMQNSLNISASDIIPTYVYQMGLMNAQYSFSTAVELFNSVINAALLIAVNAIAKRTGETSLW